MNIRNLALSFSAVAAMAASAYSPAFALLPGQTLPTGPLTCQMANGQPCTATIAAPNLPVTTFQTVGAASFTSAGYGSGATFLQPSNWTGNGTHPQLGAVSWSFDVSRSVQNSQIVSNGEPGTFPATGDLGFHITGTMGAFPGVVFHSRIPVHLRSTSLTSFAPFVNETFTLVNPVAFDGPNGNYAFTLTNIVLTLNS